MADSDVWNIDNVIMRLLEGKMEEDPDNRLSVDIYMFLFIHFVLYFNSTQCQTRKGYACAVV